jgi:threonine dehydratase
MPRLHGGELKVAESLAAPSIQDILEAENRIASHINRTPVMKSRGLNEHLGCEVFFKCENLQRVGAFKFRGACNAVFSLSDSEASKGVATHSSGNHAQALSLAAKLRGVDAHVVMPKNSPKVKVAAVRKYGGQITFCEPTLAAREEALKMVVARTGATFIHPYDDVRVISGQATACKELAEEVEGLDIIIAPVGGGGLLSGTLLSATLWAAQANVYGAEPSGADDAFRSLQAGKLIHQTNPQTLADGLRTSLSPRTFKIIRENAAGVVTTSEDGIAEGVRVFFKVMKLVVEPSGAVPLAALLERKLDVGGKRVGVIISGGNIEPSVMRDLLAE